MKNHRSTTHIEKETQGVNLALEVNVPPKASADLRRGSWEAENFSKTFSRLTGPREQNLDSKSLLRGDTDDPSLQALG